eukprot:gene13320-biopygen17018
MNREEIAVGSMRRRAPHPQRLEGAPRTAHAADTAETIRIHAGRNGWGRVRDASVSSKSIVCDASVSSKAIAWDASAVVSPRGPPRPPRRGSGGGGGGADPPTGRALAAPHFPPTLGPAPPGQKVFL